MATSAELNSLTVKELGAMAKELAVPGWHDMRKEALVKALVLKSRSKQGRETIQRRLARLTPKTKGAVIKPKKKLQEPQTLKPSGERKKDPATKSQQATGSHTAAERKREVPKKREGNIVLAAKKTIPHQGGPGRQGNAIQASESQDDRLVLLVRDPYWLQAYWEINARTMKRAEVAMGHFWHSAVPVLRLYRVFSDGAGSPKRQPLKDIRIHGGVSNWYLEVDNPPSMFQLELGYLSREKKFYSLVSSNTVETPQRQIVDELDKLDGNWRGVADDLGRIFKLSGGDANNQELRKVFEKQLQRPMSGPMLSRYRASKSGAAAEKTRRNFGFNVDADVIIHGRTDPSVQVTIRNEPIKLNPDGTFSVRFSLPEKRHVFSIEAEGNDGVEMQRVVLTVERNTRILETLFQEPTDED